MKMRPRPTGLSSRDNLRKRLNEEKQMTTMETPLIGASSDNSEQWEKISWSTIEKSVKRLQMRIAKATREGRHNKARALQWLLTHSHDAKLLAVRRVTTNTGAKTPGVDRVRWTSPKQKIQAACNMRRRGYQPKPLKRIYIPKKNGQERPLGIPTMEDRAQQALHLLSLEPISETRSDPHSYGFRPERCVADAIELCHQLLSRKTVSPRWILEGDIRACFDEISHEWLTTHVPMDRVVLSKWLKAGFVEKETLYPTDAGTPQGGIISPTLSNMALDGLEAAVINAAPKGSKVNFVRYADDFIVTGATKTVLERKVLPAIRAFLRERDLRISPRKTKITCIDDGFDFLGFNIRKYKGKLLIMPSKKNVKAFLGKVRETIKTHSAKSTEGMIFRLNSQIRGWANYSRHVVAKHVFQFVDDRIFESLWRWAKRRHNTKSAQWRYKRYFRQRQLRSWVFFTKIKDRNKKTKFLDLLRAGDTPIVRHNRIRAQANPYDPTYREYFERRRFRKCRPSIDTSTVLNLTDETINNKCDRVASAAF